jgi:UTP--glucose-1-phosphate uridylyltransferase
VVLPDDLIIGGEPALSELIKAYEASSASVVALMEVAADQTRRYGIVEPDPTLPSSDGGRIIPLRGLVEKPEPADAPSNLAIVGRYVLSPKIFETLERTQHGAGGEIQLTDAIQALAAEQPVVGYKFSGTRYDVGAPEGWLRANLDLALEHPTYGTNLRAALATHIRDGKR